MTGAQAPTRTLTFVFTDIEGSTRLWERYPEAMTASLVRHDDILRRAVEATGGAVVKTTGDGLMAVFSSSREALDACLQGQLRLAREPWGETGPLRVRMGVHTGEVPAGGDDYHGPTVNRAARIMAAGHGGQILLSSTTAAVVHDELPAGTTLRDLGEQRLKDLDRPVRVLQLVHPDLPDTFPALVTLEARAYELPVEGSVFVGREIEIERLEERLRQGSVRLVTLTGPGGIGKTSLALRAATRVRPDFEHGALFVDLSFVRDATAAILAITRALGLPDGAEAAQLDELAKHVGDRQLLLVLDNFEQVLVATPAVARLLQECARLKVIVTSREPLHLRDEYLFPVPPLALPEALAEPSLDRLEQFEAVQLFVERAQAVRPEFRLTDENASAVLEICRRLDGLPLAIELATARLTLFSPEELSKRLAQRLSLPGSGPRDLPERHQTLNGTIAWSYQLLEPPEQQLLSLLALFSGARLEDVEAVVELSREMLPALDPLAGLASLLDKSLIRREDLDAGGSRVTMLETIRAFALERLDDDPGRADAMRRAHASYFAEFCAREAAALDGPGRSASLERTTAERENLRACWRFWVGEGNLEALEGLAGALWALLQAKSWYRETVEVANDLLRLLEASPEGQDRTATMLSLRIGIARARMAMEGYTPEVEAALEEVLALVEQQPDSSLAFPVLRALASFYIYRAQFARSAEFGRRMLQIADLNDDVGMRINGHVVLGSSLTFLNHLEEGLSEFDQAIAIFKTDAVAPGRFGAGNDPRIASLTTSAFVLWLLGRPDSALDRADQAMKLAATVGNPFTAAYAAFHTGLLHLWRRQPDVIHERSLRVLAIAEEAELGLWRAIGLVLMGAALAGLGRAEEGLERVRSGVELYRGMRTPPVFWSLLLYLDAWASLQAGVSAEGLPRIEEGLGLVSSGGHSPLAPEFHILHGDLLAGNGAAASTAAYVRAHEMAMELGVRMSALRAASRLVRAGRDVAADGDWLRSLGDIYATFTEGFETLDLDEARSLLAQGPP